MCRRNQGRLCKMQGGIHAIYVYGQSYFIEPVMAATPLKKLASDSQKRQSRQNPQSALYLPFSTVLDEARKKGYV